MYVIFWLMRRKINYKTNEKYHNMDGMLCCIKMCFTKVKCFLILKSTSLINLQKSVGVLLLLYVNIFILILVVSMHKGHIMKFVLRNVNVCCLAFIFSFRLVRVAHFFSFLQIYQRKQIALE
jgi:hypothetical protein